MFPCKLREIPKSSFGPGVSDKKLGRYLHSIFSVEGFGHTRWMLGCYIDIDNPDQVAEVGEEDFVQGCINYLNQPPPRQKFERKITQSLYGNLSLYSYKLKENNGNPFVELLLVTDEQKNENFWGEGISFDHGRKRRRPSENKKVFRRKQH